jgi:hypothetical protein
MKELPMIKTLNRIQQIVLHTKQQFRESNSRPAKTQKNRYERRKIRVFLNLGDWTGDEGV